MSKPFVFILALALSASAFAQEKEESNPAVGPDKGITEASEQEGFKLSKEAKEKFEISSQKYTGEKSFSVPKSGIFFGLQKNNLFRIRGGFYRRIDFTVISKSPSQWAVSSPELRAGDEIVNNGVGYLRIVELQAGGGIADEH